MHISGFGDKSDIKKGTLPSLFSVSCKSCVKVANIPLTGQHVAKAIVKLHK